MPLFPISDETNHRSWPPEILARADEWDDGAQKVFDGRLRPSAAEQWAAREGLPPFVRPLDDPYGAFAWPQYVADLPLSLALPWISFRDLARAAWAHERRWVWGSAVDKDPPEIGEVLDRAGAERELWQALRLGRIEAVGRRPSADPLRDPGPLVSIAADEWRRIPVFSSGQSDMVGPDLDHWDFAEVTLPRAQLFRLWPTIAAQGPKSGRPSLEQLWRPEFNRRTASGDRRGAAAMGKALASWLHEEVRAGRVSLPEVSTVPAPSTIERAIRSIRNSETPDE